MKRNTWAGILVLCGLTFAGCVSAKTHDQTVAELEQARKSSTDMTAAFEASKKQSAAQVQALQEALARERDAAAAANARTAALEKEKGQATATLADLRSEAGRLQDALRKEQERLKAEEAERLPKEAEIQRLTQTQRDLSKSLEAEIAKGDVRIQQLRDRLTINMVDRVLFDSGQGEIKTSGLKVIKSVSAILKNVADKQIRIEGHTDNVPIGGRLRERFPSNWELSTSRASSVVRYLVQEGGVEAAKLSAVGYGETRPVAGNDSDEGRRANRRIEIVLYPKDLSDIATQIKR